MVSGPFDTGPAKPRGAWARYYTLPLVHQKVWDLMRQMQVSMREVGKFYGGGHPDRTMMQRPRYDLAKRGVTTATPGSLATPVFGSEEHTALKDLIAPSAGKRIGLRLRGTEVQERHDNRNIRQTAMIGALRAVADLAESRSYENPFRPKNGVLTATHGWTRDRQLAWSAMRSGLKSMDESVAHAADGVDPRYGGMQEAVAGAWTAAHYDRVLYDLEGNGKLPTGTTDYLALGWNDADAAERQQLLARVHAQAPAGYAFAEEVGKQAGMSAERTLHWLNNAPLHKTPDVAAGLLMGGSERMVRLFEEDPAEYAVLEGEVSELLRAEFENLGHVKDTGMARTASTDKAAQSANGGRRAATLALELIAEQERALDAEPEQAKAPEVQIIDPRIGTADPSRAGADAHHSPSDGAGRPTRSAAAAKAVSPRLGE
ncbi:MAG: hypothetical protein HOV68_07005 [Streptomycetaceae bacterium]|nr:hypothetical protein [Streptomycetaceae bacterium]